MKYPIVILYILCLISCTAEDIIKETEPQLVVEGWIEDGNPPEVIVSTTIPIKKEFTSLDKVEEYFIKWAKVTIDDGEECVVLTGTIDRNNFPQYRYTTGDMRGVAGRTYRLTVEYEDYYATATTSIPEAVEIDSFKIEKLGEGKGTRRIKAYFTNTNGYNFQFFTFASSDRYLNYAASHMGYVSGEMFGNHVEYTVCSGRTINNWDTFQPAFNPGDSVMVKMCRLDSVSSIYWRQFEEMSILSRNPYFPATESLYSNIDGGLGYWFGYGAKEYMLVMPE